MCIMIKNKYISHKAAFYFWVYIYIYIHLHTQLWKASVFTNIVTMYQLTCEIPTVPWNGIVENFRSICAVGGAQIVNCEIPTVPGNGIVENFWSICAVGGAQIVFRCNKRFVPAMRMSATCVSPHGISVVDTWTHTRSCWPCVQWWETTNLHKL